MIETEPESIMNNDYNKKAERTLLTSEVKVLSIGDRRECSKPTKPAIVFDKKVFYDDCKKHFGQLLLGSRNCVPNDRFMMDVLEMNTIEEDNQPRRYHFQCLPSSYPGIYMDCMHGVFGQTFYADAVMHELKKRLKDQKWISKNVLEFPKKTKVFRSRPCFEDDYYVHNLALDILCEQKLKVFQFLLYLHKQYVNDRLHSKRFQQP
ncbi:uncharacterized protein LOC26527206 isoform X2 [Drosophila mojavensis]|uniref:uncharacterized protein LOC26527206 isoform X2 n=1 Tax=Drosophila mojavensis TaxID=7230 RepID=UPI001CD153C8|nr:uncharacterized protein LOC26527206 isoform X2 [Drosophila mojavensis]